jgi:hypothetical protein
VEGDVLRVFVYHMTVGNTPGPFNFRLLDMQIATFTLPDLQFVNVRPLPNLASGPQNEWGASVTVSPTDVYVFANGTGDPNNTDPIAARNRRVARVPLGSLTTDPWQFYNGGTTGTAADWSTGQGNAMPLTFVADSPALPSGAPSVKPWDALFARPTPGGGYYTVGKLGELADPLSSTEISEWTAPSPEGPWHYEGKIGQTSAVTNQYSYGARLEVSLPGGTPTIQYSLNSFDNVSQNVSLYGVKFLAPMFAP